MACFRSSKRALLCLISLLAFLSLLGCDQTNEQPFQGYVEGRFTYLSSQSGGTLNQLTVGRGQWVQKGDQLFKLDSAPDQQAYQQARQRWLEAKSRLKDFKRGSRSTVINAQQAAIKQVKAQLVYAQKTLKRRKKLFKKQAIDQDALDRAFRDVKRLSQQAEQLRAELAEAKLGRRHDVIQAQQAAVEATKTELHFRAWRLKQKAIAAPATGLIYDTFYVKGEYVPPNRPILALLRPEEEKLVFFVPEPVRAQLKPGQSVAVRCDNCNKLYKAKLTYIASRAAFTPPVIFSRKRREKLVYRVEGQFNVKAAKALNIGQPVDVYPWHPSQSK